jgi:hypothetical protein
MAYPVTFDFTIIQGDDFVHEFEFQDENCAEIPLSGTYHAQIKRRGVALATFTCAYVGNVLTLSLPRSITNTLQPVTEAMWDLEHHDTGGLRTTIIGGEVTILRDVTEVP